MTEELGDKSQEVELMIKDCYSQSLTLIQGTATFAWLYCRTSVEQWLFCTFCFPHFEPKYLLFLSCAWPLLQFGCYLVADNLSLVSQVHRWSKEIVPWVLYLLDQTQKPYLYLLDLIEIFIFGNEMMLQCNETLETWERIDVSFIQEVCESLRAIGVNCGRQTLKWPIQ